EAEAEKWSGQDEGGGPGEGPPPCAWGWESLLLPVGRSGRGLLESAGLVLDVRGDLADLFVVLAHVVSAEEQFTAGVEQHADVGLRTTAVATVSSRQRLGGGKGSSHFAFLNARR